MEMAIVYYLIDFSLNTFMGDLEKRCISKTCYCIFEVIIIKELAHVYSTTFGKVHIF